MIEAIKITLEWERDRVDKLNKARERYTAENRIRLSTTARPRFRVLHSLPSLYSLSLSLMATA